MDIVHDSVSELNTDLQNICEEISNIDNGTTIQRAYGADDVLVLVSKYTEPNQLFREEVGTAVTDIPSKPCGFLISDGPKKYEKYTTAYVREEPDNAYEYVLGYCAKIGLDSQQSAYVFSTLHDLTGGEGDDAQAVAAGYMYALLALTDDRVSISELSDVSGVPEEDIREQVVTAHENLDDESEGEE